MSTKNKSNSQKEMSFIEKARRGQLYIACQSFVCPQIEAQTTPKGMLQTYIESNLKFIDEH